MKTYSTILASLALSLAATGFASANDVNNESDFETYNQGIAQVATATSSNETYSDYVTPTKYEDSEHSKWHFEGQ